MLFRSPKGVIAHKFNGAENRGEGLANELKLVSKEHATYFFDANDVTSASAIDGIHLDENQHEVLGKAIAYAVSETKIF